MAEDRLVVFIEHPLLTRMSLPIVTMKRYDYGQNCGNKGYNHYYPFEELPNFVAFCPNPVLPYNFLPTGKLLGTLINSYTRQLWMKVDGLLDRLGVESFVYVNSFDPIFSNARSKKDVLLQVYHCVDNINGERYIAKHGIQADVSLQPKQIWSSALQRNLEEDCLL